MRDLQPRARLAWIASLVLAVSVAAYSGLRLPSLWTATVYSVEFSDGALRRAAFGTVFGPLWEATGHEYWAFASIAFAVLAGLLVVLVAAYLHAGNAERRIIILLWLVAPTGAYLFHEVGYLEQVNYLLLFLALWLGQRHPFSAAVVLTVAVLVHEAALVTVVPLYVLSSVISADARRRLPPLLVPAFAGTVLAGLGAMSAERVEALQGRLDSVLAFTPRSDAVLLLGWTLRDQWANYSVLSEALRVIPFAAAIAVAWVIAARASLSPGDSRATSATVAWAACSLPLALVFGGWDTDRWMFLALTNLACAAYLWWDPSRAPMPLVSLAGFALPFMLLFHDPLTYFDGFTPRILTFENLLHLAANWRQSFPFPER